MEQGFGVVGREVLLSRSGVAFLKGVLAGELPLPPMAGHMGLRLVEAEKGRVVFEGAPTEAHLNPMGAVHGGWFGTILESALGCVVMSMLPQGSVYTTLEYKVNLIRAIAPGQTMRAIATAGHLGRSTGVASAELVGADDGKLYGQGSTTCLVMKIDRQASEPAD